MENDPLKNAWSQPAGPQKDAAGIRAMFSEKRHPVLKGIRRQLLMESIGYALFLLGYYDFFDGHLRPFYVNAILVISMMLALVHNITGYRIVKHPAAGNNLQQSLVHYRQQLQQYARLSIASRVLAYAGFLLFFAVNIQWNGVKYLLLAGLLAVFAVQVWGIAKVWSLRAGKITRVIGQLAGE